jgi:hypothetical protein
VLCNVVKGRIVAGVGEGRKLDGAPSDQGHMRVTAAAILRVQLGSVTSLSRGRALSKPTWPGFASLPEAMGGAVRRALD